MRPPHDAKAGLYRTSNQCEPFFIHNPIAKHPAPTTIHRSAVIFCYYVSSPHYMCFLILLCVLLIQAQRDSNAHIHEDIYP